jgi:hypothetical protein
VRSIATETNKFSKILMIAVKLFFHTCQIIFHLLFLKNSKTFFFFFPFQAENEAVLKKRENPDSQLTWEEYKTMAFTQSVSTIISIVELIYLNSEILKRFSHIFFFVLMWFLYVCAGR